MALVKRSGVQWARVACDTQCEQRRKWFKFTWLCLRAQKYTKNRQIILFDAAGGTTTRQHQTSLGTDDSIGVRASNASILLLFCYGCVLLNIASINGSHRCRYQHHTTNAQFFAPQELLIPFCCFAFFYAHFRICLHCTVMANKVTISLLPERKKNEKPHFSIFNSVTAERETKTPFLFGHYGSVNIQSIIWIIFYISWIDLQPDQPGECCRMRMWKRNV